MKKMMILVAILCAVSSNFAQRGVGIKTTNGKDVILYEDSYALVIGNSTYKDGSWGNLPGAKSDVEAVTDVLCQHGFKVEVADNLTSKTFEARIKKFINDYGKLPNNRILIYYAGHGFKQKSAGDNRDIGYVVPVDAPSPNKFEFVNYAVTMDTIENYAKEIQSKHALFVFDNCFSGKLVSRSPIIVPNEINQKVGGAVRQFITSGSAEQEVPDESGFRRAFVRGLKGEADENGDGYTTASELAVFIKGILYEQNQSPQYGKINDSNLNIGDFTFAKPNAKGDCPKKQNDSVELNEDRENPINNSPRVKDVGPLRVVLKSVMPVGLKTEMGNNVNGIRCTFEFINRDTVMPISTAINAYPFQTGNIRVAYLGSAGEALGTVMRSTLLDENGNVWGLYKDDITGISIVSVGVKDNGQLYSPTDISTLLQRQDETGTSKSPFRDSFSFVYGSTTLIPPGQSVTVIMNFAQELGLRNSAKPKSFQIASEIVVGVATTGMKKFYTLYNITFDQISLTANSI